MIDCDKCVNIHLDVDLGWLKACEIREHFDNMSRSLDWMDECGMLEITLPGHPISYMISDIRYHEARSAGQDQGNGGGRRARADREKGDRGGEYRQKAQRPQTETGKGGLPNAGRDRAVGSR